MDTVFVVLLVAGALFITVTKLHVIVGVPRRLPLWFQVGSLVLLGISVLLGWMLGKIDGGVLVFVGGVLIIGVIAVVREFRRRENHPMNRRFWWKG